MTITVGNRSHAALALMCHSDSLISPEKIGLERVGSGAFRTAYLHIDTDVVYKVDGMGNQWGYTNRGEVKTARWLAKQQWKHVRIPKVALFTFKGKGSRKWGIDGSEGGNWDALIVAMEHIPGPLGRDTANAYSHPGYEEFREAVGWRRCGDMHGGNFKIHEDMFVPIDMGS